MPTAFSPSTTSRPLALSITGGRVSGQRSSAELSAKYPVGTPARVKKCLLWKVGNAESGRRSGLRSTRCPLTCQPDSCAEALEFSLPVHPLHRLLLIHEALAGLPVSSAGAINSLTSCISSANSRNSRSPDSVPCKAAYTSRSAARLGFCKSITANVRTSKSATSVGYRRSRIIRQGLRSSALMWFNSNALLISSLLFSSDQSTLLCTVCFPFCQA